ncbi:MAG: hypothetical protein AB8B99_02975 [Phormidesmis sp.]
MTGRGLRIFIVFYPVYERRVSQINASRAAGEASANKEAAARWGPVQYERSEPTTLK